MVTLFAAVATALGAGLVAHELLSRERSPRRRRRTTMPGLDVSTGQFWTTAIGAGAVAYFVVFALTSLVIVSLVPAIVVATMPKAYFTRKRAQRLASVQEAWPDGLRDMLSSVRSGCLSAICNREHGLIRA
jgi:Flp pilus assembly protein TadB